MYHFVVSLFFLFSFSVLLCFITISSIFFFNYKGEGVLQPPYPPSPLPICLYICSCIFRFQFEQNQSIQNQYETTSFSQLILLYIPKDVFNISFFYSLTIFVWKTWHTLSWYMWVLKPIQIPVWKIIAFY